MVIFKNFFQKLPQSNSYLGTTIRLTDVQGYASTRYHVPDRYVEREKFDSGKV